VIIKPDGTIRFLTVREHLHQSPIVYQDSTCTIYLISNKKQPFRIVEEGQGEDMYIDLFALHFGKKEQLKRKKGSNEWVPIHYGCDRAERDKILLLPVEDIIDEHSKHACCKGCQYYSPPTGVKSSYAFNCILTRYRVLDILDLKSGLTLEEVSRIYGCTRERIRQIQKKAIHKLRHATRRNRLKIFQERISDYRDVFHSTNTDQIA
jgi:hypothetical protein